MFLPMDAKRQLELAGLNTVKLGNTVPGQKWVSMEGVFTPSTLRQIAELLEKGGLNDNTERPIH